jgi:hypothetical protein
VSLHDALRVSDDFILLQTTRRALEDFCGQYDLSPLRDGLAGVVPPPADWRLLVPGGSEREPTLCLYDRQLVASVELAADVRAGYATRGGAEFPRAGLRVVRVNGEPIEPVDIRPASSVTRLAAGGAI